MIVRQSFVIYLDRIEGAFKQWELYYNMYDDIYLSNTSISNCF